MKFILLFTFICSFSLFGQIQLFEHANFGGGSVTINSSWQAKGNNLIWNDKISSIKVPKGNILIIYEHTDFSGAHTVVSGNWQAKDKNIAWNDQISSIEVLDLNKECAMIYFCFLQNGELDSWDRTNDFILNSNGKGFFGIHGILNPVVDTVDLALRFYVKDGNKADAKFKIDGNEIRGWVQFPGKVKKNLYGYLADMRSKITEPLINQMVLNDAPKTKSKEVTSDPFQSASFQPPSNTISEAPRVFMNKDFTGESKYIDQNWSFGDINNDVDWSKWWRKVRSIQVPEGWELICYRSENFKGQSIRITGDWVPDNDPNWKEKVESIQIVRKGILGPWAELLNPGVIVYQNTDFSGYSRYVDKDWSFGDINRDKDWSTWWRKVKSIRVPPGFAIICYRSENFQGQSIEITGDWVPDQDPKWKENIESIRIIRRGR